MYLGADTESRISGYFENGLSPIAGQSGKAPTVLIDSLGSVRFDNVASVVGVAGNDALTSLNINAAETFSADLMQVEYNSEFSVTAKNTDIGILAVKTGSRTELTGRNQTEIKVRDYFVVDDDSELVLRNEQFSAGFGNMSGGSTLALIDSSIDTGCIGVGIIDSKVILKSDAGEASVDKLYGYDGKIRLEGARSRIGGNAISHYL